MFDSKLIYRVNERKAAGDTLFCNITRTEDTNTGLLLELEVLSTPDENCVPQGLKIYRLLNDLDIDLYANDNEAK